MPAARLNCASSQMVLPRASAFLFLSPAPGPMTSTSMLADTAPNTSAPAAFAAAVAAARGVDKVPVNTIFFPERPPPPPPRLGAALPLAFAFASALGVGGAATLAFAFALAAGGGIVVV